MYAVVEPGVITCDLAAAVAARGLFYPPDPGSMSVSTMGGNIAENSGGLRGLKYGTTKKYVMGLEVLTETGEIMKTGACGRGCEYGYNLTELLVASEGTLALTSKAVLKLVTPPKASKAMMAIFPEVKRASQAVAGIIAAHVVPCTLEFMDNATINYVEDYVNIGLPRDAAAILLIEVDGHPAQVADEAVSVEKVLKDSGALEVVVAKDAAEKTRIWEARRVAIPALARCRPTLMLEDATVPRSKIPAMLEALDKISRKCPLAVVKVGTQGAYIKHRGKVDHVGIMAEAKRVDTTGAGDFYAAGFLVGLTRGLSMVQCGTIGAIAAGRVIEVTGTTLADETWTEIDRLIRRVEAGGYLF